MTRDEAESLVARHEGRLCVRFYRRFDGSIITQDCPVGFQAVRERVSYWTRAIGAATLTFLAAAGFSRWMPAFTAPTPQRMMGKMVMPVEGVPVVQGAIPPGPYPGFRMGQMIVKRTPRDWKKNK
jgi:hypothetical protein